MDVSACPMVEIDWTVAPSDGTFHRGDHEALLRKMEEILQRRAARWRVLALNAKLVRNSELVVFCTCGLLSSDS
jgi:hypothetical protein